jgi:hypothetical protein
LREILRSINFFSIKMKRKEPLTEINLPALKPEEIRSYSTKDFDAIGLHVLDYGNHALLRADTEEQEQKLWKYLDVDPIRTRIEQQAREAIGKVHRPNRFTASAYPVGEIEGGDFVVIALRLSIYVDGSERKIWRAFLANESGLQEIQKSMTEDIEATAQKWNDLTNELGGGTN